MKDPFVTGCTTAPEIVGLAREWSEIESDTICVPILCSRGRMSDVSCVHLGLSRRSGSSFNSPNHESALLGSSRSGALSSTTDGHVWSATETPEHEHKGSAVVAAGLQPSGGVPQGGWQRETIVHRVHIVSRTDSQRRQPSALPGSISRVVITEIATTAAMSRGLAGSTNKTFTTPVQQPRNRTSLPKVASNHFGILFLAHTHGENRIRFFTSGPTREQRNRC